jgi:hypothetical protein
MSKSSRWQEWKGDEEDDGSSASSETSFELLVADEFVVVRDSGAVPCSKEDCEWTEWSEIALRKLPERERLVVSVVVEVLLLFSRELCNGWVILCARFWVHVFVIEVISSMLQSEGYI